MASVKFDNTELVNSTYALRYAKHESVSVRDLTLLPLADEDGAVLVSERYGAKYITVSGSLKGSSVSDLESKMDAFKELFGRKEKNLDIGFASGTRRYVATCVEHTFNREHNNLTFVRWAAQFVVAEGIGEATSEVHEINNISFANNAEGIGVGKVLSLTGSAEPKLRVRICLDNTSSIIKGVYFENEDEDRIWATRSGSWEADKYFEFDCRLKKVTYDGKEVPFYGVFPRFTPQSTYYKLGYGKLLDQEYDPGVTPVGEAIYGDYQSAQCFSVPYTDDTYQVIELYLKETGNPGNLTVRIETDDGGEPSGNLVDANATWTITGASSSYTWQKAEASGTFELEANTKYWLVARSPGADASNYFDWADSTTDGYKRGYYVGSVDAGSTWALPKPDYDLYFRLYYGGEYESNNGHYDIYYYPRYL